MRNPRHRRWRRMAVKEEDRESEESNTNSQAWSDLQSENTELTL